MNIEEKWNEYKILALEPMKEVLTPLHLQIIKETFYYSCRKTHVALISNYNISFNDFYDTHIELKENLDKYKIDLVSRQKLRGSS